MLESMSKNVTLLTGEIYNLYNLIEDIYYGGDCSIVLLKNSETLEVYDNGTFEIYSTTLKGDN